MNYEVILILSFLIGVVSAALTAKIIAAYYLRIIDGHISTELEMIKDLIRWAKGIDIPQEKKNREE